MIIKEKFSLLKDIPNTLDIDKKVIKKYQTEENSLRSLFVLLKLNEKRISHFTKDKILKLVSDIEKREIIKIVNFEKYILPVTYNTKTNNILINLKPFDVDEISKMNPKNIYACVVYGYVFYNLINKKISIPDTYSDNITKYLVSVFIRVFGKEYGLTGIYATGIPKLRFLISCYILSSFFGFTNKKNTYKRSFVVSLFDYREIESELDKYNFSDITDFIKSLSDLDVMKGLRQYGFTAKLLRYLSINFIPAIEDCSRFFASIITSDISGQYLIPSFIFKYNETEFKNIINIGKKIFR